MKLVFIEKNRPVTDSLTMAEVFGKSHDNVIRDIRQQLEKLDEAEERQWSVLNFEETQYQHPQNKQWYPKFNMTEDAFAIVAMSYVTPDAMKMKIKFLEEFKKMREELSKPQFALPQSMPEALRLLATEMEDKQRIQTENLMLEQRVKEYEPKISYLDSILKSTDTVTITQIAKDYGLTGQALNKLLHEDKVQYNVGGQWLLYQKHQDKGFTKSQTIDVHHTDGHKTVKMNTKWTQKGRLFIHETLTKRGIVPYMDREQNSKEA